MTAAYGEKVKAYLRRGAKPLPAFGRYPNEEIGYGVLCVRLLFRDMHKSL